MSSQTPKFLFGTVGSPLSAPKKPGGSAGAIEEIARLGLDTLELGWVRAVRISDGACALIKETACKHGIPLSVHAPSFINLNSNRKEILEASVLRLLAAARAGFKVGATDIVFHPGSNMGENPEKAFITIKSRLREIVDQLRSEKINVILRPETMGKSALFGSLEECVRLSSEIKGVQPCIDFAHLHARHGDGSFNSYDEFRDALQLIKKSLAVNALRSMHIHISGIAYGSKGEKHHLSLGESDIRYKHLLKALIDTGASGRILCESPVLEQDALLLKKIYSSMIM